MPRIELTCIRSFDPPMVRVQIFANEDDNSFIYGFDVPYAGYNEVANALNLPGNPCQGA